MTVTFFCKCGKTMHASEESIGTPVNCPACHDRIVVPSQSTESNKPPAVYARRAFLLKSGLLFAAAGCFSVYIVWLLIPLEGLKPMWLRSGGVVGTPLFLGPDLKDMPFYALAFMGILLLAQWVLLRPHQSLMILSKEKTGRPLWLVVLAAVVVISAVSAAFLTFLFFIPAERTLPDQSDPTQQQALLGFCMAIGFLWGLWSLVFFIYWKQGHYCMQASGPGHVFVASLATGFIAMLLCTGFIATILEIPDQWVNIHDWLGRHWVWAGMLFLWGFWTVIFYLYGIQGDRIAKMGRVVRLLIAGSCLELFIAIPVHAMVYKRLNHRHGDECFCARGSYTGLVFGLAVLLWAFGPGVVLLCMRENNRRQKLLERLCSRCGAEKVGSEGLEICPTCGY